MQGVPKDMDWMVWGLLAGLVLGTYDFLTKLALAEKSVLEVVFWCSALGALLWLPWQAQRMESTERQESSSRKTSLTPPVL